MKHNLRGEPDFEQFLKALRRRGTPDHLPFYEHLASSGFIARRTGTPFDTMGPDDEGYWEIYVDFWLGMGYDCIPMEIAPNWPAAQLEGAGASRGSEALAAIRTMEDFERFPWPPEQEPIDFARFEKVGRLLPEGVKIVGGVAAGPFEWTSWLLGMTGLSFALVDNPELVERTFAKIGGCHLSAVRQLASMDCIGALRQGDDLGFKTSTFLAPEVLRRHVFPICRKMVEYAHRAGKPFILHSCGNLAEVYEDLIGCGIDAKHSFEEAIMPVEEFKGRYGDRMTPLGGVDVDLICRGSEDEIRAATRRKIEACFCDGYYALGTGNSLTNYMPVENYMIVLDEGKKVTGRS